MEHSDDRFLALFERGDAVLEFVDVATQRGGGACGVRGGGGELALRRGGHVEAGGEGYKAGELVEE